MIFLISICTSIYLSIYLSLQYIFFLYSYKSTESCQAGTPVIVLHSSM